MDVPDIVVSAVSPWWLALTILAPGANMNRQLPMFENDAKPSLLVDACNQKGKDKEWEHCVLGWSI